MRPIDLSRNRRFRDRLSQDLPVIGLILAVLVGPFVLFPGDKVVIGWLVGVTLWAVVRALARKPLQQFIVAESHFGMDAEGRVHVLGNEEEAFTPVRQWTGKLGAQDLYRVGLCLLFFILLAGFVVFSQGALGRAVSVTAAIAFLCVLLVTESLQEGWAPRTFKGGVILDTPAFRPLFHAYVNSDRFDPADRNPHIATVLDAAFERIDPGFERIDPAERGEKVERARRDVVLALSEGAGWRDKLRRTLGG